MTILPPSWEKISFVQYGDRKDCEAVDELRLERAVHSLRRILGEDFPNQVYQARHPILGYFVNDASWTRFWLIEFNEALIRSTKFENHAGVVERIKDPARFHEALSVLECADTFAVQGLEVIVDPTDLQENFTRMPDLLVRHPSINGRLCVEVSTIGESREWQEMLGKYDQVATWALGQHELQVCGRLTKIPSEPRMLELQNRIRTARELAVETSSFQILRTTEVLIGFAPKGDRQLIEWAKSEGIQGSFSGPSMESNVQRRLAIRMREKAEQLPDTIPGLIWIELQTIGIIDAPLDFDSLEQHLHAYPHVIGCVITWKRGFLGDNVEAGPRGSRESIRKRARHQFQSYRFLENEHSVLAVPIGFQVRLRRCLGL